MLAMVWAQILRYKSTTMQLEPKHEPSWKRRQHRRPVPLRRLFDTVVMASFEPFFSIFAKPMIDVPADISNRQRDFDTKVAQAVESLRNTSTLISELQSGVRSWNNCGKSHDRYSQLAQIEAKKAEALLKEVEKSLGKERKTERWVAFAMHLGFGLLFFVLGVVLSDPLKNLITRVWTRLFH